MTRRTKIETKSGELDHLTLQWILIMINSLRSYICEG